MGYCSKDMLKRDKPWFVLRGKKTGLLVVLRTLATTHFSIFEDVFDI